MTLLLYDMLSQKVKGRRPAFGDPIGTIGADYDSKKWLQLPQERTHLGGVDGIR